MNYVAARWITQMSKQSFEIPTIPRTHPVHHYLVVYISLLASSLFSLFLLTAVKINN